MISGMSKGQPDFLGFPVHWEILPQMGRHPVFVSLIGGDLVCRGRYYLSVLLWYLGNPSIMHNIHVLFIYMVSDPKELGKYLAHGMVWITLLSTVPKCSTRISGNPIASSHHSVDPSSGSPTWLHAGFLTTLPPDKHICLNMLVWNISNDFLPNTVREGPYIATARVLRTYGVGSASKALSVWLRVR